MELLCINILYIQSQIIYAIQTNLTKQNFDKCLRIIKNDLDEIFFFFIANALFKYS